MADTIPTDFADLLERPLFGHLATVHPDGSPHSSVMWFDWDGQLLRFTHTSRRQKYRNLLREPRMAMTVVDPDDPTRYLEVRGTVVSIEPDDAEASFYRSLQERYGDVYPIKDADVRVVITARPEYFRGRGRANP